MKIIKSLQENNKTMKKNNKIKKFNNDYFLHI
jgi:hypothetical protein